MLVLPSLLKASTAAPDQAMPLFPTLFLLVTLDHLVAAMNETAVFTFNGFSGTNLSLDGMATVTPDGLLMLTNGSTALKGHAFYPAPLRFHGASNNPAMTTSFSTAFVFGIIGQYSDVSSQGMAFVVSASRNFSTALPGHFLGLVNPSDNGEASDHLFAVELDTVLNAEFRDIDDNHVGVDVNSLTSVQATSAGYFDDETGSFRNLSLISRKAMQVWVEYDGQAMELNVTMAPVEMPRPKKPLLSTFVNLSAVITDDLAYVGFSSSTGIIFSHHYVLGWSFKMNGMAPALNVSMLPALPRTSTKDARPKVLEVVLPIASVLFVLALAAAAVVIAKRRAKFAELREDWEADFGPHRFAYKDLFYATDGFKGKNLLGKGGFGGVYMGVLPKSKMNVAVKRVSHESRQGMKEFLAEIVSLGRLRHRSVVQLLGYCRRKGELLLVYDYMPNGSLDMYLHDQHKPILDWGQRFKIIKGVASGLLYLHEDWEKVVIHRDIKPSNVLLDAEMNGRLGDFGLARLYDHGTDPNTTHVIGTMGYLAPELGHRAKATPCTDVFAFGVFLLEVACGRRPVEEDAQGVLAVLVDRVLHHWRNGLLMEAADPRLGNGYAHEEVERVLKLGLLCSHPLASARPSMRRIVQCLDGDIAFDTEHQAIHMDFSMTTLMKDQGFDQDAMECQLSSASSVGTMSSTLSGGR